MTKMTSKVDMRGKVCIVTGSSSGIGKETASELAGMGATVVMVVRDRERGESAMRGILQRYPEAKFELLVADLSSVSEIRRAANEFRGSHETLDVLVNNAGGVSAKRTVTPDGLEMTFAINYLAPFLLTHELLDALLAGAPSRVINVSSTAHTMGRVDLEDLQGEKRYGAFRAYENAKLMNIMLTYEMARRLDGTEVTVNALHPGFVASNFGKHSSRAIRFFFRITRPFQVSPHEGAQTSIYLASSSEVDGVTGKYFYRCRQKNSSKASYDVEKQRQLWQATESILAGLGVGLGRPTYSVLS